MKVLMTSQPGHGHIRPMIPIAQAFLAKGHEVTMATGKSYQEFIEERGIEFVAAGLDFDEARPAETLPEMLDVPPERRARWLMDTIFMDRAPRAMFPLLNEIVSDYDLVIHDTYEYAGALAAEKHGVPYVCCNMSFLMRREGVKIAIGKSLQSLRREVGLPDDKQCNAVGRYADLRTMPINFSFLFGRTGRHYRSLLWQCIFRRKQWRLAIRMYLLSTLLICVKALNRKSIVRPLPRELFVNVWRDKDISEEVPTWLKTMPKDRKTVFVSLGTVFNRIYPQVFDVVLKATEGMNINLVVAVGRNVDITTFGPQPPNVYIKDYVDQQLMMPYTDLCIAHGGFSTTMKALNAGVPLVILPLSADQPTISDIATALTVCVDLPFSVVEMDAEGSFGLNVNALDAVTMRDLVERGLSEDAIRKSTLEMKTKMDQLPSEDEAVDELIRRFRDGFRGDAQNGVSAQAELAAP